ncbi:MAG TPA: amidase, partial [Terriglobia bacterium]|nr:amidase [Terriglobia bacterium]
MNPETLSLTAASQAIRDGVLSPVDYVKALFARIDKVEPQVRAWVTLDRDAVLADARQSEAEARNKQFRGVLHGVPVGIKDLFYTKGLRTTMGSEVFRDFVPQHDSRAVARLKEAGAIILGKTVTTMFANLDPGPTRNPWNVGHTPGGSSSGSAAAVAARMCPAAIGSQTLGSVGRPAAFCGIPSLVATQQRISLSRVWPLSWSLDHVGIFGSSVADLGILLQAMSESVVEQAVGRRTYRIGVVRDFFYEHATEEARSLNDALANKLAGAGFHVEEARLPAIFELAQAMIRTIVRCETASVHEQLFPPNRETYAPKIRAVVETGMLIDARDYLRARRLRRQYQRGMAKLFENFDALMTPAAPGTAPEGITTTGDPVMNAPWTLADFPIMTLPYALGANGLPMSVQLCGPPLQEGLLLQLGRAVESVVSFEILPPLRGLESKTIPSQG